MKSNFSLNIETVSTAVVPWFLGHAIYTKIGSQVFRDLC